jgi:hypothetical protein
MLSSRCDDCLSCVLSACRAKVRSTSMSSKTFATFVRPAAASIPARNRPSRFCSLCQWNEEVASISSDRARVDPAHPRCKEARSRRSAGSGARHTRGDPSGLCGVSAAAERFQTFPVASGVALARTGVDVAIARWGEVHRPLLAVSSKTVSCFVPRCSERVYVTMHPFPDPPPFESHHCVRTLGQVNTTDRQQSSEFEARRKKRHPDRRDETGSDFSPWNEALIPGALSCTGRPRDSQ